MWKLEIQNPVSKFRFKVLNFIRPRENFVFAIYDINDVKLLTRSRLNFSHPNFWHNFNNKIDPICSCGVDLQRQHFSYLLHCDVHCTYRLELFNDIYLNPSLENYSEKNLSNLLNGAGAITGMNKENIICLISFRCF